jgi:hypothetical protein
MRADAADDGDDRDERGDLLGFGMSSEGDEVVHC